MTRLHLRLLCATALCVALVSGCTRTTVQTPLLTDYPPDDIGAEASFWDLLPTRSAVTNDEGLHGLLLSADGTDNTGSYAARVAEGVRRGWLPKGFSEPANLAMQRGRLAVAVCVIAKIRGGVTMMTIGPTPRYATRELIYLNMMQASSTEYMSLSGLEFMAVVSKMQDYMDMQAARNAPKGGAAKAAEPMPSAPVTEPAVPSSTEVPEKAPEGRPQ